MNVSIDVVLWFDSPLDAVQQLHTARSHLRFTYFHVRSYLGDEKLLERSCLDPQKIGKRERENYENVIPQKKRRVHTPVLQRSPKPTGGVCVISTSVSAGTW